MEVDRKECILIYITVGFMIVSVVFDLLFDMGVF